MILVVPAASHVSGGHVYDREVVAAWPGEPPEVVTLAGDWPDGHGTGDTLAAALRGADAAIVDGLVGAAHPDVLTAAERAGTRLTLLVHLPLADETGLPEDRRRHLTDRERASVHACTRVVATSRIAAADLASRHGRADVDVAPPGATPGPVAVGSDPPLVLCLAALIPRKNHLGLVAALSHLQEVPWQAVLAGPLPDPALRERIDRAVEEAGLTDRITLPGPVEGADLADLWARSDVLVLPSLAETYGMVVTEAVAHGVPVVVASGTGSVEALRDTGDADADDAPDPGLAVDARDPAALADGIAGVLGDPTWRDAARRRRATLRPWGSTATLLADRARSTSSDDGEETGR